MLSNEYRVYVKKNIDLARSICVKSQQTIEGITQYLQNIGITISFIDPATHKYYVNLRGEYWNVGLTDPSLIGSVYESINDKMMSFVSIDPIDAGTSIELTNANLLTHPNSYRELREFDTYFNNIVTQWPNQEPLIRRIINPITIPGNEIAEMEDGTILYYDERLVESNEINLISSLQLWIYNYSSRWNIIAFQNSDELYAAAWIGIFYLNMVGALVSIRLENIKTNEVHSFHLWNYLGSYFYLDRFQSALTKEQALFLYRNMEHLMQNVGNKSNLSLLYDNVIKNNGMRLNAFEIRQHNGGLLGSLQYDNKVNKYPIDSRNSIEYTYGISTVDRLIRQMDRSAVLNPTSTEEHIVNLEESVLHSSSNAIDTGIIECERRINPLEGYVNQIEERMKHWFFFALVNRFPYQFTISVGEEKSISLTAKQAVYLLLYCSQRYQEYNAHTLINSNMHNSSETPYPYTTIIPPITIPKLLNYDAGIIIPDDLSSNITNYLLDGLSTIHNTLYGATELLSIEDLTNIVSDVMDQRIKHVILMNHYSNPYDQMTATQEINNKLYRHYVSDNIAPTHPLYQRGEAITLLGYTEWEDFLSEIQWNDADATIADYEQVMLTIIKEFIGETKVHEGMISPYFEMMEILKILSSYTVTFIPSEASGLPKAIHMDKHQFKLLNFSMNFLFSMDYSPATFSISILEIDNVTQPNHTVYPQLHIPEVLLP